MSKWARRTDKNHQEIRDGLRALGFSVFDSHRMGGDFPDLVVANEQKTVLVEVKSKTGKPTDGQNTFAVDWKGEYVVAYTLDDVLQVFEA